MAAASESTVLVVDDDQPVRDFFAAVLQFEGYACECFSDSLAALAYLSEQDRPANLMLADINMPEMTGMELLKHCKALKPEMPVILVSGLYGLALALEALESGADDYLRKPVLPTDIAAVVGKYLQKDLTFQEKAVQEALKDFIESRPEKPQASRSLEQVFRMLGFKRYETFQHSKRVAAYSRLFGQRLGLSEEALDQLELGALLHDIGKIGIPHNVLLKPDKLNDEEWKVMRTHPSIGYRLVSRFENLAVEADLVYGHHERFDGGGYPRGLEGDKIPLSARLFAIVDTFDAMTSDRPYRAALSVETACDEIRRMRGLQFDPALVDVFLQIPPEELDVLRERYPDTADEDLAPVPPPSWQPAV